MNCPAGPRQAQFSFQSGAHSKETGCLATPVLSWFLRSKLGSLRVLRGNHPCRGGGREGFEMNPRTGRELSASARQLLSLRGEIQCLHPSASPSLLPFIMCSEKYSLFAQSQWQFTGCPGAPRESPRAARLSVRGAVCWGCSHCPFPRRGASWPCTVAVEASEDSQRFVLDDLEE